MKNWGGVRLPSYSSKGTLDTETLAFKIFVGNVFLLFHHTIIIVMSATRPAVLCWKSWSSSSHVQNFPWDLKQRCILTFVFVQQSEGIFESIFFQTLAFVPSNLEWPPGINSSVQRRMGHWNLSVRDCAAASDELSGLPAKWHLPLKTLEPQEERSCTENALHHSSIKN